MNLVDILILGFILLGALHGYQRGLITSIVNLVSSIVGFVVASWQYLNALNFVQNYFPLQERLEPLVYRLIFPAVQSKVSSLQESAFGNLLDALPQEWRGVFAQADLSGGQMPQAVEQLTHRLSGLLSERILFILAFACVFFVVFFLIQGLVSIILRPFGGWAGAFNRGGGLLFGGISAMIGLAVLAGLLSPLMELGASAKYLAFIQSSTLYPYLVGVFHIFDQALFAQMNQKLLEPLSQLKGVWF